MPILSVLPDASTLPSLRQQTHKELTSLRAVPRFRILSGVGEDVEQPGYIDPLPCSKTGLLSDLFAEQLSAVPFAVLSSESPLDRESTLDRFLINAMLSHENLPKKLVRKPFSLRFQRPC